MDQLLLQINPKVVDLCMAFQVAILLTLMPTENKMRSNEVYIIEELADMVRKNINKYLGKKHNTSLDCRLRLDNRLVACGLALFKKAIESYTQNHVVYSKCREANYMRQTMLHMEGSSINYKLRFSESYFSLDYCFSMGGIITIDGLIDTVSITAKKLYAIYCTSKSEIALDVTSIKSQCDILFHGRKNIWNVIDEYDKLTKCYNNKHNKKIVPYHAASNKVKRQRLLNVIERAVATETDNSPDDQFSLMHDLAYGNVMKRQIQSLETTREHGMLLGVENELSEQSTQFQELYRKIRNKRVSNYLILLLSLD